MRAVHDLLRGQSAHRTRVTFAAVLLLVDSQSYHVGCSQGQHGTGLRDGHYSFVRANTDTKLFLHAADQPQAAEDKIKQRAENNGQHRTKQKRKQKSLAERGKVYSGSHGDQTATDDRARDCVGSRDRKPEAGGDDHGKGGAEGYGEEK